MARSTNSLDSLSSPSPSPSPPPSASKSTNVEPKSGLASDSELSELTEEEQEAEKQKRKQASSSKRSRFINGRGASSSRPSRRGGRRKRGSIVPTPMWGWAETPAAPENGEDEEEGEGVGSKGAPQAEAGAEDDGASGKTFTTFSTSPKNLPDNETSHNSTHTTIVTDDSLKSIVESKLAVDVPINPLDVLTTAAAEVVKSTEAPTVGDETESESEEIQAAQPSDEASGAETDSDAEEGPVTVNGGADELEEGDAAPTKPTPGSPSSIASSRSATPTSYRSPSPAPQTKATVSVAATVAGLAAAAKVTEDEEEVEVEEVDEAGEPVVADTTTNPTTTASAKSKSKSKPHMAIAIPDPGADVDIEPENVDIDMDVDVEAEVDVDIKEDEPEDEKEEEKEVDEEEKEEDVDDAKEEEDEEKEEEDEDEEEELELQPAHRVEALEVLATIELKFALLREKVYVEKMEELAWEESLVSDGTHPELIYLHGELSRRKDKRLELASKKRSFEVANIHKRRKLDEGATWSWWKLARDDLQTDMIAETNRKRRRLERERRAVERPQPIRRIPQPPTEVLVSPPTLRKIIKSDPFNTYSQSVKRKDRRSKRDTGTNGVNGINGHSSISLDRPAILSYPELTTLNPSDVRSDLELIASFKRSTQPPPTQSVFDSHPIGHGHPHRINTPSSMIPPPHPSNIYDHQYVESTPSQLHGSFFGPPGGRSMTSQPMSSLSQQGLPPYGNPSLGSGSSMGQGGRPGSSAGLSAGGSGSRPHHIHHHPSPTMSNQPPIPPPNPGHAAPPFPVGPVDREPEILSHNRSSSLYFNEGQGPSVGYGRRSPSPPLSMHAGPSSNRPPPPPGIGYEDRPPIKLNFPRDEREREALFNSKDPETQHALRSSRDPEVRQYIRQQNLEFEQMWRVKERHERKPPTEEELGAYRHTIPGTYLPKEMENSKDPEMRQRVHDRGFIIDREITRRERERESEHLNKYNVPYRQPHHHHHHHYKPHHHHVVHHHHVQQPSSSTSPHPSALSPRTPRGEIPENGGHNRPLLHQHPSGGPPVHATDIIDLSSSKGPPPPSSSSWKGDDIQSGDYRDVRSGKISSRPPSGPPLLDERERDRHIPVPFAMGSSQPPPSIHPNGPPPTSSPRPAWNTTDHDDSYRPGSRSASGPRDVIGSPGHRFATSTSQNPLSRNGSLHPSSSPPRSRMYRPSSPPLPMSHLPPGPGRSPTRYRERSPPPSVSLPLNHSKIMRPGSPPMSSSVGVPSPSVSSAVPIGGTPLDIAKHGTRPASPEPPRSNGGPMSSTSRLIEKGGLSPRLSSTNTSPPKMSVPQMIDSHS